MKKELLIGLLLGLAALVFIVIKIVDADKIQTAVPPVVETPKSQALTSTVVAKHATQNDCWMIIRGSIYDITSYFSNHPGGDNTMSPYCGKDATTAYETKNKNQPHSTKADVNLETYLVGTLSQ